MLQASIERLGYRGRVLLEAAELQLEPGSIKGLVAPNGTGKTTLLRYLAGNRSLGRGTVTVDGVDASKLSAHDRSVLYVPGDGSLLYGHLSALDHLRMVRDVWRRPFEPEAAASALALEGFARKPVRTLSQGQRQLVSLAVGFCAGARYLFLDEPMNALDPTNIAEQSAQFRRLATEGVAILYSSHLLDNIGQVCDAVVVMCDRGLEEFKNDSRPGQVQELYWRSHGAPSADVVGRVYGL